MYKVPNKIKTKRARQDYTCFICEQLIEKRTDYIYYNYNSPDLIKLFEDKTKCHPIGQKTIWEVYMALKFCSHQCLQRFLYWRRHKTHKSMKRIRDKYYSFVMELYKKRSSRWKNMAESDNYFC